MSSDVRSRYTADLVFLEGRLQRNVWLDVDAEGVLCGVHKRRPRRGPRANRFRNKALLPGLVNTHSHAFQLTIRGRTESVPADRREEDFWTWRERMYHAALRLTPRDVYLSAKMAFIEMLRAGITTVGEFHYLHNQTDGEAYADRNELAKQILRAAREAGIRMRFLRVAYGRSGYQIPPNPLQRRFFEPDVETFLRSVQSLAGYASHYGGGTASVGVAPHSIRAVEASWLTEISDFARAAAIPYHIHACEPREELRQSRAEYGREPIEVFADLGLLRPG
ncbi:MAG: amidohydrolase family protein, partial [Nitrospinota bacterium]